MVIRNQDYDLLYDVQKVQHAKQETAIPFFGNIGLLLTSSGTQCSTESQDVFRTLQQNWNT